MPLLSAKAQTAASWQPGSDSPRARAQRFGPTPPRRVPRPPGYEKRPAFGLDTPETPVSLAQAGGSRRHSACKGGDGGAPTHHGERSARVGAGAGERLTESECFGAAWAEVACK